MNFSGKVAFLRDLIVNTLTPLISDSYVLWDLPYYTNIGDILIWEGTENFLKQLSSQCISKCSYQTFSYPIRFAGLCSGPRSQHSSITEITSSSMTTDCVILEPPCSTR